MLREPVLGLVALSFCTIVWFFFELDGSQAGKPSSAAPLPEPYRKELETLGIRLEEGTYTEAIQKTRFALSLELASQNETNENVADPPSAFASRPCVDDGLEGQPVVFEGSVLVPPAADVEVEIVTAAARAVLVGNAKECEPWTLDALVSLPQGAPDASARKWNVPLGLGFTVAPTHCLAPLAWDADHLEDAALRADVVFFLDMPDAGGAVVRQPFTTLAHRLTGTICSLYSESTAVGMRASGDPSAVAACLDRFNAGAHAQFGYHHKFPTGRLFGKSSMYFLVFRDPLMRGLDTYARYDLARQGLPLEEFFTAPIERKFVAPSAVWAEDVFWYLGVDRIRTTDPPDVQLAKLERAQFAIRATLPLIAERPLESLALLSVVLGGSARIPVSCTPPHAREVLASEDRWLEMNVTRHAARIGQAKSRHVRILYEYAHVIFDLRLRQFGVQERLQAVCTDAELSAGGFGHPPELLYLDDAPPTLP